MTKCGLSIEIDPDAPIVAGDTVRGHIRVDADADVRCRSITVYSGWRTRGQGNVAQQFGTKVELFSGNLTAGQSLRLPFEIETLRWPPSYNGYQFSIEHFIETTADIPWAFDPKVSIPIPVLPGEVFDSDFPQPFTLGKLPVVVILGGLFTMGMIALFALVGPNPIVLAAVPMALMTVVVGLLFVFQWIPAIYVGQVDYDFGPTRLAPGDSLVGTFSIRPRRNIHPEFIRLRMTATEVCVSGSGSNAKTHRHTLFQRDVVLAEHPQLVGGQTVQYEIDSPLPPVAAYSIKVPHNELQWAIQWRVGIPGWVDWKVDQALSVVPPGNRRVAAKLGNAIDAAKFQDLADQPDFAWLGDEDRDEVEDDISFEETAEHLWHAQDDLDQLEYLVDAVVGLPMAISVRVQQRFLRGESDEPEMTSDEQLVWAEALSPPLPLALYVPQSLAKDFDQADSAVWRGVGEVVGWNHRSGRLQIRVYR